MLRHQSMNMFTTIFPILSFLLIRIQQTSACLYIPTTMDPRVSHSSALGSSYSSYIQVWSSYLGESNYLRKMSKNNINFPPWGLHNIMMHFPCNDHPVNAAKAIKRQVTIFISPWFLFVWDMNAHVLVHWYGGHYISRQCLYRVLPHSLIHVCYIYIQAPIEWLNISQQDNLAVHWL